MEECLIYYAPLMVGVSKGYGGVKGGEGWSDFYWLLKNPKFLLQTYIVKAIWNNYLRLELTV